MGIILCADIRMNMCKYGPLHTREHIRRKICPHTRRYINSKYTHTYLDVHLDTHTHKTTDVYKILMNVCINRYMTI